MSSPTPEQMYPILKFFAYDHLPHPLRDISQQFFILAREMVSDLPYCPETSAGLRKLLEAKDCFVRAALELVEAGEIDG